MLFPVKAHYAAVAMLHLAVRFQHPAPSSLREIAEEHHIPLPFLTQILQHLKASGLVTATRGPTGGYRLSCSPQNISMGDIVDAVHSLAPHETDHSGTRIQITVSKVWFDLDLELRQHLDQIKLSQLVERHEALAETMFYI